MLTVLIVDDGPEFRLLYSRILKRSTEHAFSVIEAGSIAEGMAAAKAGQVDCVLLDYRLPDGMGTDFISSFRKDAFHPKAAILLCTGQESEDLEKAALSLGATACLSKSNITKETLLGAILGAVAKSI